MTIVPLATGPALPEHSNDGYVAAAYIVFFAIVLIYVAIMAVRLSRVERELRELSARAQRPRQDERQGSTAGQGTAGQDATYSQTPERETV